MSTEPKPETWYTVTVIQHEKHPRQYVENDTAKPVEIVAATVLPPMAGSILRAAADQVDPPKPVMRRASGDDQ